MEERSDLVSYNKKIHDLIAKNYDLCHPEIFNPTEQGRLKRAIHRIVFKLQTKNKRMKVLDFGAGTGNLTKLFLEENKELKVVAADVSEKILSVLNKKYGNRRLRTQVLNGKNLKDINQLFDVVAMYSVLHHVPNYKSILVELISKLKKGGILYIDHEVDSLYWHYDKNYLDYLRKINIEYYNAHISELGMSFDWKNGSEIWKLAKRTLLIKNWFNYFNFLQRSKNKDIANDGDIYVYKSKHINWDEIIKIAEKDCNIIESNAYLVCRETGVRPTNWLYWNDKLVDMRYLICQKK